ncbi:MAG: hypothetical protein KKF62_07060 [Bacteroidetes bacterium]|nr:hypothetical protein [Bacteroidota bacterium]MBU1115714.1 hypothetical protein [Bacteroidota bacterium]MBU1799929.1 hypothetical protein [Bacteroidota bacterium]
MKRLILALVLLSLLNLSSFAQGEGALPGLTLQTSMPLLGAGWIGTAKPNNDPIGYYLNPAILGYSSQNNHVSLFFMPKKVDWIPSWSHDLTKNTFGFNVGYNFKELGLPISVGFGYMHDRMDYGRYLTASNGPEIIRKFTPYDSFDAYSFGVGFDYYLIFNLGISIKPFESDYGNNPTENEISSGKVNGTAYDYGAMIITPISKLFFDDIKYKFCETAYIKPNVNFTLGYAITNVGDKINYIDEAQSDPLSRTGRLGYTFDFGLDAHIIDTEINLFTYSFTAEVEDILIKQITEDGMFGGKFDGYQSLLGDIDIWDNLLLLNPSDKVVVHKGHTLNLFETLTITSGSFLGKRYPQTVGTSGYGLSSEGILKIVGNLTDNLLLKYFAKHFVLEYYDASIFRDYNNFKTDMQGISLHMKNIEL